MAAATTADYTVLTDSLNQVTGTGKERTRRTFRFGETVKLDPNTARTRYLTEVGAIAKRKDAPRDAEGNLVRRTARSIIRASLKRRGEDLTVDPGAPTEAAVGDSGNAPVVVTDPAAEATAPAGGAPADPAAPAGDPVKE